MFLFCVSPSSGTWCRVVVFFDLCGEISLLLLSKKIEGLVWRNRKIDERNGTGDQNQTNQKLRMCDMSGGR